MNFFKLSFLLCLMMMSAVGMASAASAEEDDGYIGGDVDVPQEVAPFVIKNHYPIYLKKTDLNKDGLPDYLMVLEDNVQKGANNWNPDTEIVETARPLIILQRGANGKLTKVKQNDKLVYCRICGGAFGDPFSQIEITKKGFIIYHYGGSNWRWTQDYEFAYSRIDKTWQLIRAKRTSFHTSAPDEQEVEEERPPKDFGKIDLADFDPENYLDKTKSKKDK